MAVSLTAVECPAVQMPAAVSWVGDAFNTLGNGLLSGCPFPGGNSVDFSARLNKTSKRIELLGRYGGGGYGICNGLGLTAAGGLTISVAAGQAMADGIIENYAAQSVAIPNVSGRAWLWLQQSQDTGGASNLPVITPVTGGSLLPPASNCVLLGSCVVAAGVAGSIDTSGVMYLAGGMLYRNTADLGQPGDTPPSGIMFRTITAAGVYDWSGTVYLAADVNGVVDSIPSGIIDVIPVGRQELLFGPTKTYGRLDVYGRKRVIL